MERLVVPLDARTWNGWDGASPSAEVDFGSIQGLVQSVRVRLEVEAIVGTGVDTESRSWGRLEALYN